MAYSDLEQAAIDEAIRKLVTTPRYRMVWWRFWLSVLIAWLIIGAELWLPPRLCAGILGFLAAFSTTLAIGPWRD